MQPQDIRLADTIGDVTEGEPGCYQMPASVDSANRYSLISVLGEGGLGIVYRAKDNLLPREVAVKIGRVNDADVGRHILREASILTLLDHPNITPVYDSGYHRQREPPVAETNKGFPFFVMKLVVGKDLRVLSSSVESDKRRKRDRWTQLLRAFADVCRAVQHAHDRGVVHGDPKPMNIIVDIDHRPWLIDWGLSRVIDPARLQSTARDWLQQADNGLRDLVLEPLNFGGIIGTPSYMSPEQARGEGLSEETDIYVLGATLFTILTGELPFSLKGGDFRSFLGSLLADKRPRPRDVDSSIPRKLEAICMKAMARDPKERHANAAQLAEDIRSWVP
jgi:serine/threonine protein kinase